MGDQLIITGIISIASSLVTGWTTWFFTRRKYNSEVDSNIIQNMKESLDFYRKLSDDNKERLEEVLKRNEALEQEVAELRKQMFSLMGSLCMDLSCQLRKRDYNLFNSKKEENGNTTNQKVQKT